jgi:chemotaxis protein histidine kinase CheA
MLSQHAHQAEDMLEQIGQCGADQRGYILNGLMKHTDQMHRDMEQIHEKIALIFGKDEQSTVPVPRPQVEQITSLCRELDRDAQPEGIRELIDNCIRLSWKPLESLTRKYQKIVSRIARRHQKTIKFVVKPERVFFPANIFSDADDALIHLVRNAADHGIEAPEIRQELGKGVGRVFFELLEENENRIIKISDDGQGIDTEKLVNVCIQKNLITREEAEKLSAEEKLNLIFRPGISTSAEVSDISGRGFGMDVVLKKIESLGGTVSVESEPEKGSTVTLVLPKRDA